MGVHSELRADIGRSPGGVRADIGDYFYAEGSSALAR